MRRSGEKTAQLLNMPAALWVYVDDLKATGLHGSSTASIIRSLVQSGIQDAIGKGLISLRSFPTAPATATGGE